LALQMFAALAEYERALIQERIMAGIAAARARGRTGGRKPKLSPEQQRVATEMARGGWPLPRLRRRSSVRGIRCIRRWSIARSRSSDVPPADAEEPFRPRHSPRSCQGAIVAPRPVREGKKGASCVTPAS
jgi:hypothetical protein